MKLIQRIGAVLAAITISLVSLCLPGCMTIDQTIVLKADGSGTIETTMKLTKAGAEQIKQLGAATDGKSPIDEMLNEEKAKEQVAAMGEGVKFLRIEKVKDADGEGARAIYSFEDITKVKMNTNFGEPPSADAKDNPFAFTFTKGSPATLTLKITHDKGDPKKPAAKDDTDPAADPGFAMAQQMMKGMRMTIGIKAAGGIAETDATHRAGDRIIIADILFDGILKDAKKFKAMEGLPFDQAMELLKGTEGVKIETKETVTVKVK